MKVSYNCLKQYVDLNGISPFEVADKLTFAGVEVETVTPIASGTNLVIGEILTCENHVDSDHLHVLNVDLGSKHGVKQIVCGAPNARKGLKVIVAMEGAVLPEVVIKKGVIRGVESNGMCCSLLELGVDKKYLKEEQTLGIEELPSDAEVGNENVLSYLGLDDYILDLKVLANRPDLLSVLNVAKEVGAIFNKEVHIDKYEELAKKETDFIIDSKTNRCTQFSIKVMKGIKNTTSPKWMQSYLMAMGIRPIDALVDIGNYVMLISGQPLHIYDYNKLDNKELIVRDDLETEFVALDDKTYNIKHDDICITSNGNVMCLGGVMGSKACAIDENSKDIVIEAASFDATTVRHTTTRLGLSSESSSRFVKGTNHFQAENVLNFTAYLIKTICGCEEMFINKHYQKEEYKENIIKTTISKINGRLGSNFKKEEIINALNQLSFKVLENGDDIDVVVPSFRLDVNTDADIAEEVIRFKGFDNVISKLPNLNQSVGHMSSHLFKNGIIEEFLISNGLDEALTYTLVSKTKLDECQHLFKGEAYKILNPLTEDHEYVRMSILPMLIDSAIYNIKRQNKNLAMFEISDIISRQDKGISLAVVLSGVDRQQHLLKTIPYDFYSMKGILEGIMELLGIANTRYSIERNDCINELHPGKSAVVKLGKQVVGYFGHLHPTFAAIKELDKTPMVVMELRLDTLYDLKTGATKMSEISKFPSVERDLAIIVDKKVMVKDLIKEAKLAGKGIVASVDVFDVFEGGNLNPDTKSIALKVMYLAKDHTLKDDEVSSAEKHILEALQKKFKAILRG